MRHCLFCFLERLRSHNPRANCERCVNITVAWLRDMYAYSPVNDAEAITKAEADG